MNVVVTGARTGIGRATVEKFAANGHHVFACARRRDAPFENDMSDLAARYDARIAPVYFDLESEEEIKQGVRQIQAEKCPIDVLVNNAGVFQTGLLLSTSMQTIKTMFEVNVFSQIYFTQLIARMMIRQKKGAIVNVSSTAGLDGDAATGAYGMTKASVALWTKTAARELAPYGIRVNAIAPGLIDTEMADQIDPDVRGRLIAETDLKRMGDPKEAADAIYYLASDEASYITGQTLRVDGGAGK